MTALQIVLVYSFVYQNYNCGGLRFSSGLRVRAGGRGPGGGKGLQRQGPGPDAPGRGAVGPGVRGYACSV